MRRLLTALAVGTGIAACSIDEHHVENIVLPAQAQQEKVTCNSPTVKVDLSTLKDCSVEGKGKGHCYDVAKVPFDPSLLAPCSGGAPNERCVPDSILAADGGKLKSCTFAMTGQAGACLSLLTPEVFDYKDLFTQDACAPDERCLPCVDPRNNQETGLCTPMGAHQLDCIGGPSAAPVACCHGRGECIAESAVPEEYRGYLVRDSCAQATGCAPTFLFDNTPHKCTALGLPGVCFDVCFAAQMKGMTALTRGGCGLTEVCMPCALANLQSGDMKMVGCE